MKRPFGTEIYPPSPWNQPWWQHLPCHFYYCSHENVNDFFSNILILKANNLFTREVMRVHRIRWLHSMHLPTVAPSNPPEPGLWLTSHSGENDCRACPATRHESGSARDLPDAYPVRKQALYSTNYASSPLTPFVPAVFHQERQCFCISIRIVMRTLVSFKNYWLGVCRLNEMAMPKKHFLTDTLKETIGRCFTMMCLHRLEIRVGINFRDSCGRRRVISCGQRQWKAGPACFADKAFPPNEDLSDPTPLYCA